MFVIHCGSDLSFSDSAYTCSFCVETDDGCFPSAEWDDFPLVVLGWWIRELKAVFISPGARTFEFRFMDGPYRILCQKSGNDLTLSFMHDMMTDLPDCITSIPEMYSAICIALDSLHRRLFLAGHPELIPPVKQLQAELKAMENHI